jgi:hypothetical protein
MNNQTLIRALSFSIAAAASACLPNDHLLVGGNGGDAGSETGAQPAAPSQDSGAIDDDPTGTASRRVRPLRISGRQALTRMAGVIWNAAPDDDLLSQDSAGHFTTVEDLYGPARQMLADSRAVAGVGAFYRWWLHLPAIADVNKDQMLFPEFTNDLRADMAKEPETFGVNVTLSLNGSYRTLMTAPFSFINARLASIYGAVGVTGDALRMVALDPQQRAGLLTQPGLQALNSAPMRNNVPRRGKYTVEAVLCLVVPPPPPNIPDPPLTLATTMRQWLAPHRSNPPCASCHTMTDPFGLAYEGLDAIGRVRATENGLPIDVSALSLASFAQGTEFNGPIELANLLAGDAQSQQCMTRQWLAFALGRELLSGDVRSVSQAYQPFRAANFNLKELIANIVLTDSFLAPEASPRPFAP